MFSGRKVLIVFVFAVLLVVAFGAGCHGFFVDDTLSSVAIQPTAPQVNVGSTLSLQAWGTYSPSGNRKQITSGVSWSISSTAFATIDPNSGVLTGVAPGTATVTASAQALSGTATATVTVPNISSLTVNPTTWSVGQNGGSQDFTATANGTIDVTTGATWTVAPTPTSGSIQCTNNGISPPETCTVGTSTTAGSYKITVTYPGTTLAPFVTLGISP